MGLQEDFEAAAVEAKTITPEPEDEEKLELYAFYKQAIVGDVNTGKPGMFDPRGRYKWNAWNEKKGMSKEEAMTKYIALVQQLKTSA